MTRTKAALSHLLLSLFIFSGVVLSLLFLWYPAPYFTASGGWQGLKIAAGVDLVLGPLLTLIVFNVKKSAKTLFGDLVVIAFMQFTALVWGVYTIYDQRPVAVVFWEHEFMTVPAASFAADHADFDKLKQFGKQKPVLAYAEKPTNLDAVKAMLNRINESKLPPHHQIELYRPLSDYFNEIIPFQLNMEDVLTHNDEVKQELDAILANSNNRQDDYYYFSLRSKYHNIILLFSHDGELENYIAVKLD